MEVTINGRQFKAVKMDPFKQFHVLRRMGSLFPNIVGAIKIPDKLLAGSYVAAALSKLSDDDANFVMNSCLATCQMNQAGTWAPVTAPGGALMFQDLLLPDIMELVWKVLEDNFAPFIKDLLAKAFAAEV